MSHIRLGIVLGVALGAGVAGAVNAQETRLATRPDDALIELNFPPDVELRAVVDYIAQRLHLNILYDDRIDAKKVTLAAPARISAESLPALLNSVLRLKGFILVDAGTPGWKRVVPLSEPAGDVQVASVMARHVDAADLVRDVRRLLDVKLKAEGAGAVADVSPDPRTNQVVIVGSAAQITDARQIIELIDVAAAKEETPVRFYKLANTTAADVLETIRSLEGEDRSSATGAGPADMGTMPGAVLPAAPGGPGRQNHPARSSRAGGVGNGPGAGTSLSGGSPATNGLGGGDTGSGMLPGNGWSSSGLGGTNSGGNVLGGIGGSAASGGSGLGVGSEARPNTLSQGGGSSASAAPSAVHSKLATVAADANTNSIIVVGPPATQRLYENLIHQLDRRRPQVLVESTIVTLDTSHNFSLGVEIAGRRNGTSTKRFIFSSFGLSQVDPTTGQLSVVPGPGLNGAVLSPDIADVIIRALQEDTHSKIVASPRVLVNDNATGTLASVAGSPVTSINANNTISTTSFAGYAEAGTEILLTPHISEKDYLQLEYQVTLSSFTGQSSDGIPPPIQKNTVASEVTIPDGSTIVVGGLNRAEDTDSVNAVPFLGDVPLLGNLFRSRTDGRHKTTLFVFLRPIILRDEEFEDLRFLSERDLHQAGLPDGAPVSAPMLIE